MSDTQQKFLDQSGVEYLWSKIAKQENDTTVLLKDIVEAIDEIKANKEDILQSDWNQNDNAAKDYIKNRPFYEKVELSGEYLIPGTTFTSEFIGEGADGIWYGTTFRLDPQLIQDNNNRQVNVTINNHQFNGKVEIIDQGFNILLLESPQLEITGWLDDNPAGMTIREYQLYSIGENSIIVPDGENSISLEFMTQELKTIDPQFLPSVQSDWNVDDEKSLSHIANRPFYEKVINTEIVPEITVIGQSMGEDPDTGAVRWGFAVSFESFSWLEGRQIIKFIIDGEVYEFEVEPNYYWEGSSDRFLFRLILDDWPRYVNVYDRREWKSSYVFSLIQSGVSEIKKIDRRFLPNSTADWNANDSTIEGYVANRTHYLNIGKVVDIPNPQNRYQEQSAAFYTGIYLPTSDIELYLISNFPNAAITKNNYGFKVYDHDNLIAYYLTWDAEWHKDEVPNPDPFYDEYGDQFGGITEGLYVCLQECMDSQYNIWYEPYNLGQITCVNSVEKLKDYYLPDTVARKSDIHINMDEILDKMYPVGAIYLSVNDTSPASTYGGTWEQIEDVFLLGAGSAYAAGTTGGEATHTLTIPEMPMHNHIVDAHSHAIGLDNDTTSGTYGWSLHMNANGTTVSGAQLTVVSGTASPGTNARGGGLAHNNMPPYLVVYMWKRIE